MERYYELSSEQRYAAATRSHEDLCFAGLSREPAIRDWLHDCYFAAVAGDSPTFESWPVPEQDYLHQSLLALWGCPIGEMWDLDILAEKCRARGKWSFFMTSAPANMPGMYLSCGTQGWVHVLGLWAMLTGCRWSGFPRECDCYSLDGICVYRGCYFKSFKWLSAQHSTTLNQSYYSVECKYYPVECKLALSFVATPVSQGCF